jgi:hypothetical protein
MLRSLPGEVRGFVGAVCCPLLRCGAFVPPGLPLAVRFSQLGAFVKRLGCTPQRRRKAFGGLTVTPYRALNDALALRGLALVSGLLSAISRLHATLPLLEPSETLALSPPLLLGGGLITLVSQAIAMVRDVLTVVGDSITLVRDPFPLVRDPVALIRSLLALVRQPLALVGHPIGDRCL